MPIPLRFARSRLTLYVGEPLGARGPRGAFLFSIVTFPAPPIPAKGVLSQCPSGHFSFLYTAGLVRETPVRVWASQCPFPLRYAPRTLRAFFFSLLGVGQPRRSEHAEVVMPIGLFSFFYIDEGQICRQGVGGQIAMPLRAFFFFLRRLSRGA